MIDNEKVKKAFIVEQQKMFYSHEQENYGKQFSAGTKNYSDALLHYAGYVAGHREAEEGKRELIEALIQIYKKDWKIGINDICKNLIEKHTGKPIDEVVK